MVKILRLELGELSEELEFALVWFTAAFLLAMRERRSGNKRIRFYEIRAEIEGKIAHITEYVCFPINNHKNIE